MDGVGVEDAGADFDALCGVGNGGEEDGRDMVLGVVSDFIREQENKNQEPSTKIQGRSKFQDPI